MFIAAVFRSWEWLMDSWSKPSPKHQLFIQKKTSIWFPAVFIYISLYIQTPFQRIYTDHCHVRLAFHSSVLAMLWASVSSFALQAAVPWATRRLVLPSSSLCASSSSTHQSCLISCHQLCCYEWTASTLACIVRGSRRPPHRGSSELTLASLAKGPVAPPPSSGLLGMLCG